VWDGQKEGKKTYTLVDSTWGGCVMRIGKKPFYRFAFYKGKNLRGKRAKTNPASRNFNKKMRIGARPGNLLPFFFCVLRIGSKTSKTCLLLRNGESGRVCAVYEKSIVLYKSKLFFYKKY